MPICKGRKRKKPCVTQADPLQQKTAQTPKCRGAHCAPAGDRWSLLWKNKDTIPQYMQKVPTQRPAPIFLLKSERFAQLLGSLFHSNSRGNGHADHGGVTVFAEGIFQARQESYQAIQKLQDCPFRQHSNSAGMSRNSRALQNFDTCRTNTQYEH